LNEYTNKQKNTQGGLRVKLKRRVRRWTVPRALGSLQPPGQADTLPSSSPSSALRAHQHPHICADCGGWPRCRVRVSGARGSQASGDMEQSWGPHEAWHCAEWKHCQNRPRGDGRCRAVPLHGHQCCWHHPVPCAAAGTR
jgi:hypothetical protein